MTRRMTLLRDIRVGAGKTYEQVAADLGISVSTVTRHELGQPPLNRLLLLGYGAYYSVDPDTIEQGKR